MRPFAGNPTRLAVVKASSNIAVGWLILAKHEQHPRLFRCVAVGMAILTTVDAVHDIRVVSRRWQ